jgi:muconolactone delta-isomerase
VPKKKVSKRRKAKKKKPEKIKAEITALPEATYLGKMKTMERRGGNMLGIFSEISEAIVGTVIKAAKMTAEQEFEMHMAEAGELASKFLIAGGFAIVGLFAMSTAMQNYLVTQMGMQLWQSNAVTGLLFIIIALFTVKDV